LSRLSKEKEIFSAFAAPKFGGFSRRWYICKVKLKTRRNHDVRRIWERENREYERLMALEEAEEARLDTYSHNIGSRDYTPKQSLASRLLTGAAIYHFLKKLF